MGKWGMCRGESAPIFCDGIGRKYYQGQRLQTLEDRVPNRRLVGHCSFDFGWWDRLVVHPLVALQIPWVEKDERSV